MSFSSLKTVVIVVCSDAVEVVVIVVTEIVFIGSEIFVFTVITVQIDNIIVTVVIAAEQLSEEQIQHAEIG